jgi:hypothetical protein
MTSNILLMGMKQQSCAFKRFFKKKVKGYKVTGANDGLEDCELVRDNDYDLVL